MITADIILDTRTKGKNGYPVKIRVYDSLEDKKSPHRYVALKIYQPGPDIIFDSNLKRRQLDLEKQIEFCNDNIYRMDQALDIIKNGIPDNDIDIEIQLLEKRLELLKIKKGIHEGVGLIEFGNKLIEERQIRNLPTESYKNSLSSVKKFIAPAADLTINSIDKEWINSYDLYCIQNKLKDSTILTYVSLIRAIYLEAQSRESLSIKKDNPFLNLRIFRKDKVETDLTIDDLKKILSLQANDIKTKAYLGQNGIKQIADLLLFQFAIGGHDLVDIANLKWKNVSKGRIKFKRYKNRFKVNGGPEVDNKLNDFALEVIKKYGDKSNDRIFTILKDPSEDFKIYRRQVTDLNRYIYPIIKRVIQSDNNFSSKSTRYLFRTTGGNLLIDSLILMILQGHKRTGISFGYQGAINYEVQDREHKKILDLVFQ